MRKKLKSRKIAEWLKTDIVILSVCLIYYTVLYFLDDTCIIRYVIKRDCLTCGCTRAILCLLSGDLGGYFAYNYMALPLFITIYGFLHTKGKMKVFFNTTAVIISVCLVLRYIYK